jgi:hypothetical protein
MRVAATTRPLCLAAYKYMLNACRIPADQDCVRLYDPAVFLHHPSWRGTGTFFCRATWKDAAQGTCHRWQLEGYLEECKARADAMHTGVVITPPSWVG